MTVWCCKPLQVTPQVIPPGKASPPPSSGTTDVADIQGEIAGLPTLRAGTRPASRLTLAGE